MGKIRTMIRTLAVTSVLSLLAEDVPDEFVTFVKSPQGAQFVDTGIVPKSGTRVELDFAFLNKGPGSPEVVAGAEIPGTKIVRANSFHYGLRAYVGNSWGRFCANTSLKNAMDRYVSVTTFKSGANTCVQNGVNMGDDPNSTGFTSLSIPDFGTTTLYLFAENNNGTAAYYSKIALYGAKIWQEEGGDWVLKRDYKPCLKDGRAGLYDDVTKTISYSGSGTDLVVPVVYTVYPTTTGDKTPGQQIIDAVAAAAPGDTIFFKKGTYTFGADEYAKMASNDKQRVKSISEAQIAFVGEDTSSRKTWTEGAEPVIIDVNGGRFTIVTGPGATFTGLTFTGAEQVSTWTTSGSAIASEGGTLTVSNCVFRGNAAWRGGACGGLGSSYYDCLFKNNRSTSDVNQSTGGAIKDAEVVKDCDFIANEGQSAGAVKNAKLIDNCTFKYNLGLHNGYNCAAVHIQNFKATIRNCHFEANTNVADKVGGILRFEATDLESAVANDYSLFVSNCTFKANFAQSYNGWAYGLVRSGTSTDGTLKSRMVCEDCQFLDNYNKGGFSGVAHGITARRCTFKGNHGDDDLSYIYGDCARASDLYDCDISDGEINGCSLTRCTLHDITSRAVFMEVPSCYVTNCLIRNCRVPWAVVYSSKGSEFVNCTFALNAITDSNHNNYLYEYSANATNINCVYYGNTNASGNAFSVGVHNDDDKATIRFVNCALGPGKQTGLQYDAGCFDIVDPSFAAGSQYLKKHPDTPLFSPTPGSPLRGKGLLLGWTADDVDLAARGRVRDGKVDVGCYQCWLDWEGTLLLLR